jgi:hypothetical protein
MPLASDLADYVAACTTGLWIRSYEHDDVILEMARLCRDRDWSLATWDISRGLVIAGASEPQPEGAAGHDPLAAVHSLKTFGNGEQPSIVVLVNYHRFLGSPEVIQAVAHQVTAGKQTRSFLVILSPVVELPKELEKLFTLIEHALPQRGELEEVARGVACQEGELPEGRELDWLLDAAAGMTRLEAENVFALSLVRHGRLDPQIVFDHKAQILRKGNSALTLYEGQETFEDIGGLDYLKQYCAETLSVREENPKFRARGVLLMGVSGGGKSLFAKALGRQTGRPTLCFDIGATLGSLLGQSQAQFREALAKAEAMAPSILFIDEIEKALSGAGHDGPTSGGVKTEMFGHFLTWLQDRTSDVYVIATCNDVRRIVDDHPEFVRRFDQLFFVDFPDRGAKDRIWEIHLRGYELIGPDERIDRIERPDDDHWSGAEIENCCRQARLRHKSVAHLGQIMPRLVDQAAETIEATRKWASGRCFAADHESLYRHQPATSKRPRRKAGVAPSDNGSTTDEEVIND